MAYRAVLAVWVLALLAAVVLFAVWSGSVWFGALEGVAITAVAALLVGGSVSLLIAIGRVAVRVRSHRDHQVRGRPA